MNERYMGAKRAERSRLLNEMEQVTGLHRKSLTSLMHAESLERLQPPHEVRMSHFASSCT